MNGELNRIINDLTNLRDNLRTEIGDLKAQYEDLIDINKPHTKEEVKRSNEVREKRLKLLGVFNELEKDLDEINTAFGLIQRTQKEIINATTEEEKKDAQDNLSDLYKGYENLVVNIAKKYDVELPELDEEEEMGETKSNKFKEFYKENKKLVIGGGIATIALLIALAACNSTINKIKNSNTNTDDKGIGSSSSQNSSNEPTNENSINIPELDNEAFNELTKVTSEDELSTKAESALGVLNAINPDHNYTLEDVTSYLKNKNGLGVGNTNSQPTETPKDNTINENSVVADINDVEMVAEKGTQIADVFNKYTPYLGVDDNFAINSFNWTNGGVVNKVSLDEGAFVIDSYVDLLVAEKGNAEDVICGRSSDRKTPTETIDYSIFFLDGTRGQKLANKLGELRSYMILNAGKDISKQQQEFAELFLNSWILRGHEEISAASLETSGMEAMIDLIFLNTAPLCGDPTKIVVKNPADGQDITLAEIIMMANTDECVAELVDEDGVVIETYDGLDKSTADLIGMVSEAATNKQLNNGNGLTLSK